MSRAQRDKGRKGEAEVRAIYEACGFTVRGLEGAGDHLAIGHGLTIHSEVKRQEVLRLPLWTRQAVAEAPEGAIPIVAYRQNRGPWTALVPETQVGELLRACGHRAGIHYSLRDISGTWFVTTTLVRLLDSLGAGAERLADQEAV